jgi:hypothetical protein
MKITSKNIFDYVQEKSAPLPILDWVCNLDRKSDKALREVLNVFKACTLVRVSRPSVSSADQPAVKDLATQGGKENITIYSGLLKLKLEGNNFAKVAVSQLVDDFAKDEGDYVYELNAEINNTNQAFGYLYELSAEAFGRRASNCTPLDISALMARLAGKSESGIDVYCNYGYGLFLGAMKERGELVSLVGSEIGQIQTAERIFPGRLKSAFQQAKFYIDHEAIFERMCVEANWIFSEEKPHADILLVNAATEDYPLGFADGSELQGELNFIFNSDYKKIIILVSNTFLTGGRGHASVENLSKYFRKNGLTCVFELPAGCVGAMHERHSILVFEPKSKNIDIKFRSLDLDVENPEPVYRTAMRGFGHPLRKVELNLNAFTDSGETAQEHKSTVTGDSVFTIQSSSQNQRHRNQFVSFEASRFLPKSQLSDEFKRQYQFLRLDDLVSIRRVQHIEVTSDSKAILCSEISSDDINEFGILGSGKKKYVPQSSERRLENSRLMKGDILLCIRGPVGKVALVRDEPSIPLVSTQNFLRLRLRNDCESKLMTPEFLYWWLRSDLCQGLIKNFEIAAGVMRLSMRDIDELEVPVGPDELLRTEIEKYQRYDEYLQEFLVYERKVRQLADKAFI